MACNSSSQSCRLTSAAHSTVACKDCSHERLFGFLTPVRRGNTAADNAALLAVSILALSDPALAARLDAYRAAQTASVMDDESNAEPLPG